MKSLRTRIIVNPISGTNSKTNIRALLQKHLSASLYDYEISYTKGPTHATELAAEAVEKNFEVVMAVGGDGTVNEVATGLVHSDTALGIIPSGSGNGLGRHLKIPSTPLPAMKALNTAQPVAIDVCSVNDHPFFNVAGVGYDAQVAHDFAASGSRGLATYTQIVMGSWFSYRARDYRLSLNGEVLDRQALMITVANGSQFGNNAYIAPDARLNDGEMDITIMSKFPAMAVPLMALQLFSKEISHSRYTELLKASELVITQADQKIHLDGEPYELESPLHFKVLPGALNILVPKAFLDEHPTEYSVRRSG